MADVNLASLNFKLHIDDDGFSDDIKKYIDMAQKMNTEVSGLLEGLGKVTSGRNMSQSKKNEMLLGLRNQLKEAEADVSRLESKLASFQNHAKHYGTSPYLVDTAQLKVDKIAKDLDEARKKVLQLQEAYKKLGGDKALASTFKQTKKDVQDTSIELLQMREYYKQIAADANSSAAAQKKLTNETRTGSRELRGMSRMWRDIKNYTMLYFSFEGARRLVSSLVRVSAEFEKQRVSLRAILQDADGAERIFGQIKELAVMSPFTFKELVSYTKQLSAFSVPMEELFETTKMLADVSAGLGVGMDRLVLAYGQIRSASFLRGQEVRQLTEAGIPILEELRKQFEEMGELGITAGQVFDKISSRQVTFQMVEKVFKNMTSAGGKFYQMQEVLAETLSGKLSNLTDAYQIMFAEIGEKSNGILYGTVDALRSLAENYEEVGRALGRLIVIYGTYRTMAGLSNIWMSAARIAAEASVATYTKLGVALKAAAKETKAFQAANALISKINPYALAVAGITAFVMAVTKAVKYTSDLDKTLGDLTSTSEEYNSKADAEVLNLQFLFRQMQNLNSESADYKAIRNQIMSQYGSYLSDMDRENLAVGNLASVYDKLASSIKQAGIEKMVAASREKIADYYKDSIDGIWEELNKAMTRMDIPVSGAIANELRGYIIGTVTELSEEAQAAADKIGRWAKRGNFWNSIWRGSNPITALMPDEEWKRRNIDGMKDFASELIDNVDRMNNELADKFTWANQLNENNTEKEVLDGWKGDLQAISEEARAAGIDLGFTIDKFTDLVSLSSDLNKEIDEATQSVIAYRNAGDEKTAQMVQKRLEFLQRMQRRIGSNKTAGGSGASTPGEGTKERVQYIQDEIRAYQKLQDTYESLISTMSDEDARRLMEMIYPQYGDMVKSDFSKSLDELNDELLAMALYSDDAAKAWQSFQDALSSDKASTLLKSAEAAEKLREEIQKWIDQGYDLTGNGFSFDISRVLRDLTGKNATTNRTFEEMKKSVDAEEAYRKAMFKGTEEEKEAYWKQYKLEMYHLIDDIAKHEMANNTKVAQEKINDLAGAYVKEAYRLNPEGAIELTDWGDKSLEQITQISSALRRMMSEDLVLPDKIKADAEELGITFEDLVNLIKAMFKADYENTLQEKLKRIGQLASNVSNLVGKIGSSLSSLGDHIKDTAVQSLGDMLKTITDIASAVTECEPLMRAFAEASEGAAVDWKSLLKSADMLTMAVKIVGIGFDLIVRQIEKQYDRQIAIAEAAKEYKKTLDEIALSRYDGVLGVNDMGKLAQYYKQMADASKAWAKSLDTFMNSPDLGKVLVDALRQMGYDLENLDISQLKELSAVLHQLSAQGNVSGAMMDALDEYIEKLTAYEDAISDIFSKVADDIVDNLVTAFDEIGDSVDNIESAFFDLGDTILRSVLKSMVLENIVEKYKNDFMKAVTEYSLTNQTESDATAFAAQLGTITSNLRSELEDSGAIFNAIIEAFRDAGLVDYNMDNEVSNTVGGGIKSITEDTANLLASYINAIRADVAAIRQAVTAGNTNALPSPTLAEYLTQIQANTYNNAVAAQAILENLQSMMTMSDGPALRVFM